MIVHGARAVHLERAVAWAMAARLVAPAVLLLALLPGLPVSAGLGERAGWIAAHPWIWRLGWLPWVAMAVADFALAAALLASPRARRWQASAAFLASLGAAAIAIPGPIRFGLWMPELSARAVAAADFAALSGVETNEVRWVFGWAPLASAFAWAGWSWVLRRSHAGGPARRAALAAWPAMALAGAAALVWAWSGFPFFVSAGLLLAAEGAALLWVVLVAEQVFTEAAPYAALPAGAAAPWFPPPGKLGIVLANSRLLKRAAQRLTARVGPPALRGELLDAVFVVSMVPIEELRPFVPAALEPIGLGPDGRRTLLTHAVFRLHRVGPRLAGPLRLLSGRRHQSALGVPVRHRAAPGETAAEGVYLLSGAVDALRLSVAARLFYEGVPLHRAAAISIAREEHRIELAVDPGGGSAPDLRAAFRARLGTRPPLPATAAELFGDWEALFERVAAPGRLLSAQPHLGRVSITELSLEMSPRECLLLEPERLDSAFASAVAGEAPVVCFVAPRIGLRLGPQRYAPLGPGRDVPWPRSSGAARNREGDQPPVGAPEAGAGPPEAGAPEAGAAGAGA